MTEKFPTGSVEAWHLLYLRAVEERIDLTPEEFARRIEPARLRAAVLERLRASERTFGSLSELRIPKAAVLPSVPGFRVDRPAGPGDSGSTFHAWSLTEGGEFALKVFSLLGATPRRIRRFQRECAALEMVRHKNVVGYRGAGRLGGALYLAMDWVEGCSLLSILGFLAGIDAVTVSRAPFDFLLGRLRRSLQRRRRGRGEPAGPRRRPTPAVDVGNNSPSYLEAMISIGARLADGLAAVHAKRIVHRDLSPSNVMLRYADGEPVLVDFGLAKRIDAGELTATGELLGKPHYVAPEYARALKVGSSARADVYSLGVVIYQMLTLAPPFEASATLDVLRLVVSKSVRPPRRLNPAIPRRVSDLVCWSLEKDPAARLPSASVFAAELRKSLRAGRRAASAPARRHPPG